MSFFYPVSNYYNKLCKVSFNDGQSKEGVVKPVEFTQGYSFKLVYDNGCLLFNAIHIKWIDIIYSK